MKPIKVVKVVWNNHSVERIVLTPHAEVVENLPIDGIQLSDREQERPYQEFRVSLPRQRMVFRSGVRSAPERRHERLHTPQSTTASSRRKGRGPDCSHFENRIEKNEGGTDLQADQRPYNRAFYNLFVQSAIMTVVAYNHQRLLK